MPSNKKTVMGSSFTPEMREFIRQYLRERKGYIGERTQKSKIYSQVFAALRKKFPNPPVTEVINCIDLEMPLDQKGEENLKAIKDAFSKFEKLSSKTHSSISPKLEEIFQKILNEPLCEELFTIQRGYVQEGILELSSSSTKKPKIETLTISPEQAKVLFYEMLLKYVSKTPLEDVESVPDIIRRLKATGGYKAESIHEAILESAIASGDIKKIKAVFQSRKSPTANYTRRAVIGELQYILAQIATAKSHEDATRIYNLALKRIAKFNNAKDLGLKMTIETIPLPLQGSPTIKDIKEGRLQGGE